MRYNKQELAALASQTSHNFDREGVLVLKEKQDGFFRRSEGCSARWFRLKGNLLFYLKGPEPLHEPLGVIVLGQHTVKEQNQDENGHWPFHLIWENKVCFRIATLNKADRTNWVKAIQNAPYSVVQSTLNSLQERLNNLKPIVDIQTYRMESGKICEITEIPLCELALSCDNLLCDANGKPPSPTVVVYVMRHGKYIKYGKTETVESCSNPSFSKTTLFRVSDGLDGETLVKIVACNVMEKVTDIVVMMGSTSLKLSTIQEAQRLRVALMSPDKKTVGFVTIQGWGLEPSHLGSSPTHSDEGHSTDLDQKVTCHRRSQSLPPRLGLKLKFPIHRNQINKHFLNSHQVTYRFHSGLGGEINVHEYMFEVKCCNRIPEQLLDLYVRHDMDLVQELFSIKGLAPKWRLRQMHLAKNHNSLIKHYYYLKYCLRRARNPHFKPSSKKDDPRLEFAPVNLHLQRMWVHNDTLNRSGFYNVVTSGAFALHKRKQNTDRLDNQEIFTLDSQETIRLQDEGTGGLLNLVQRVKDMKREFSSNIQESLDNVFAIQRLCEEAGDDMDRILVLLPSGTQRPEINSLIKAIKEKTRNILALWEPINVDKIFAGLGWPENTTLDLELQTKSTVIHEQTMTCDEDDVSVLPKRCRKAKGTANRIHKEDTIQHPVAGTSKQEPEAEDVQLQFQDDYFSGEEGQKYKNYSGRPVRSPVQTKGNTNQEQNMDFAQSESEVEDPCGNCDECMSSTDRQDEEMEVEPDLSQVKLEMLKKLGKIILLKTEEFLTSTLEIMHVDPSEVTQEVMEGLGSIVADIKEQQVTLVRWAKVGHAALRLQYEEPSWAREYTALQVRRDICFSQALTAVTAGLLCWLNSAPHSIIVKLLSSDLGPLCGFEGLLSLFDSEKNMWGDMVVAIEDLQTVVFTLTKDDDAESDSGIPQVSGRRGSIVISLPVSESLYKEFTCKEDRTFTITAVFFNIGINDNAHKADVLGFTKSQRQSNCDNLERLDKYYHKFNKMFPAEAMASIRGPSKSKPLEQVVENLRIAVQKKGPKNTYVLRLASLATRLMYGVRFTSCKSGKDRTGMSVTLEQCSILASEYHLAKTEMMKALNVMRSEGCRRENARKNIGVRRYAFTKTQVMALPVEYRPPVGTYGVVPLVP